MELLETIEGCAGEQMASAVLKFLFVNSSALRELFALRLKGAVRPAAIPTFREGVRCRTEVQCADSRGRIDPVIEEARVVVGIENKFWAFCTPGQPSKYQEELKKIARSDGNDAREWCIVVLAPESRCRGDIKDYVEQQSFDTEKKPHFITWEDLVVDLEAVRSEERSEIAAVAKFLAQYIKRGVLYPKIPDWEQLVGMHLRMDSAAHYDFLHVMKGCFQFPESIYPAKDWIGFNFRAHNNADSAAETPTAVAAKAWFGIWRNAKYPSECWVGIHAGDVSFQVPEWDHGMNGMPFRRFDGRMLKNFGDWKG